MKKLKFEIEIDIENHKCSDKKVVDTAAYVLAIFLERYCQYIGQPKIKEVRSYLKGKLINTDTHERATAW